MYNMTWTKVAKKAEPTADDYLDKVIEAKEKIVSIMITKLGKNINDVNYYCTY